MLIHFEVTCRCNGIVEKILKMEAGYVYEREPLCLVRTAEGSLVPITSQFSGWLKSVLLQPGQGVSHDTVFAEIEENLSRIAAGSD